MAECDRGSLIALIVVGHNHPDHHRGFGVLLGPDRDLPHIAQFAQRSRVEVFVRSWRGTKGRWYRDLAAGGPATLEFAGQRLPVQAIPASDTTTVARASRESKFAIARSPEASQAQRAAASHANDLDARACRD